MLMLGVPATGADAALTEEQANSREREVLRRAIEELQRQQQRTRAERDGVSAELAALEREIGSLASRLRNLSRERQQLEARHARLLRERKEQEAALDQTRRELAALVRAAYLAGREERLKLFLNQEDPALLSRILGYHDYFTRARSEKLRQLRQRLEEVARLSQEVSDQQQALEQLAKQVSEERQRLAVRNRERKSVLTRLERRLRDEGERLRRMREDEQRLARVVARSQQALQQLKLPDQPEFGEQKGRLIWPLQGRLAITFGTEKIGNLRWDGVIIKAPEGREVKAVHSGRVAYADWLRGYGLLIIIDHGDGYMTLYGHNQSLFKETGDWVSEGEVIGLAGRSGGLRESGIYFGIRHKGRAVNPVRWCRGKSGRKVG
jgi:septal ring factor EnvC (AmiA/AmiB activator)